MTFNPTFKGGSFKKIRAVIYVRYSTTGQKDESAEAQIRACEEFARKNGMVIVRIYQDLGFSGSKNLKKRVDFNKMIRDSKDGSFEVVLTHDIDRFARSQADYYNNERKLNDNGVSLIPVKQPFGDSDGDRIAKSVMVTYAEIFSRRLSNEVKYKSREYARKGLFLGGTVPFGYYIEEEEENDVIKRRYKVNQEEAVIIKKIFELYSKRFSKKQIVDYLYKKGYVNRQGKPFATSSIKTIIDNDIYIGTYSYNKHSKTEESIIIKNNHEAIIANETWNKVVKIKQDNKPKPRKRKSKIKYYLTGILKCGTCGRAMSGRGGTKLYRYYGCSSKENKHNGFCSNTKAINKEKLEMDLWNLVTDKIFKEEYISFYAEQILNNIQKDEEAESNIKELTKRKNKISAKLERLMDLYLDGKYSKEMLDEKEKGFADELEIIESQLFEYEVSSKTIKKEDIEKYLYNIKEELLNHEDDTLEQVIKLAIDSVVIDEQNINVYFNVFNPYHEYGMGNNFSDILDKQRSTLPLFRLPQISANVYKLENGVYLGHIQLER